MHAAIVAGGLGTRAVAMTGDLIPKALLPVAGVPIIFRQMRVLRREGVARVSVLAGHLGDRLRPALETEAAALELELQVMAEPKPLGSAGCLTALDPGAEETLIIYGDMLFDIALVPMREFHRRKNALLTVVAHPNDHPRSSDLIVERDGLVQEILPQGRPRRHDRGVRRRLRVPLQPSGELYHRAEPAGRRRPVSGDLLGWRPRSSSSTSSK